MENLLCTFTQKKNPPEFLVEQRGKSNEQQAKSNEQEVTSNEQKVTSNEQGAKSFISFKSKVNAFVKNIGINGKFLDLRNINLYEPTKKKKKKNKKN